MKKRIAIVYPWPNLDSVPSLCNTATLLAQRGYVVDIFTYASPDFKTPTFGEGIDVIVLRNVSKLKALLQIARHARLRRSVALSLLRGGYRAISSIRRVSTFLTTLWHAILVWRQHRLTPYQCFIGVDPEGLLQAHSLAKFVQVPIVYHSLELLLSNEVNTPALEHMKRRETDLSRRAAFIIIQDRERARLLAEDNHLPMEKFVLVPHVPLGPARYQPSRYWHQRFGLPEVSRVVLHAGSLGAWTAIEEIVDSVALWPENWVLVVHTRYNAQSSSEIEELRSRAAPGRVFFSLDPVSRQEYDRLVDGADIGIAFYVLVPGSTYTQQNIQSIGLSSGKIAYYLRSGLPAIVNETASVCILIQQEHCGVVIPNGQGIGEAIEEIASCYEEYSANACRSFDKNMDFVCSFRQVIEHIERL